MWFLGVLERLLRPLMRTLSLQNDTSQGDGGPPLSSHSPSSVVDASNVASNTMIPPSPTCNRNKEEKKKKKKTKIMELLSTEFSSNYFTRPRNIFTSAPRRKYPFSLRERKKKNFHDTNSPCSKPGLLHATRAKWISALYEHSRPRILRLRCNLQGEPDVSQRHRPIPGVLPK